MFEFECAQIVGAWISVQAASSEEAGMPEQTWSASRNKAWNKILSLIKGFLWTKASKYCHMGCKIAIA